MREMKIAVATDGGRVAAHFGRCPQYTLLEVAEGRITSDVIIPSPGHEPGFLPGYLAAMGVTCMMAGGMGPRAQTLFAERGIAVVVGVSGPVRTAVQSYIEGTLQPGASTCEHEDGGHTCGQ